MNILYVENHSVFAKSVTQQFLFSHTVTIVPTISAARRALCDSVFDLLLVDYDLDDGKGDELVQEMHSSGLHEIIIIGVSSHEEGNAALLKAGAATVCSKMEFDKIQAVIDKVLKMKNG